MDANAVKAVPIFPASNENVFCSRAGKKAKNVESAMLYRKDTTQTEATPDHRSIPSGQAMISGSCSILIMLASSFFLSFMDVGCLEDVDELDDDVIETLNYTDIAEKLRSRSSLGEFFIQANSGVIYNINFSVGDISRVFESF